FTGSRHSNLNFRNNVVTHHGWQYDGLFVESPEAVMPPVNTSTASSIFQGFAQTPVNNSTFANNVIIAGMTGKNQAKCFESKGGDCSFSVSESRSYFGSALASQNMWPSGNSLSARIASVLPDLQRGDLRAVVQSQKEGRTPGDVGIHQSEFKAALEGVDVGTADPRYYISKVKVTPGEGQLVIDYVAPKPEACSAVASDKPTLNSKVGTAAHGESAGREQSDVITGLGKGTYYVKVTCGNTWSYAKGVVP
ncbi:MAG TPA: hypothetical protein VE621_11810, partial [Bryobacteraceae bacterium]|nr:hypothetical protein [Bryobacteraceae bacterium]